MERRCTEVVVVWGRVIAIGLIWVQVGKRWDRIRVSSVKVHLRLRSAQSAIPVCALEALVTDGSMVGLASRGSVIIHPWDVVFAVEVRPLDLAWERWCQEILTGTTSSTPLTIIVRGRTSPPGKFPGEECYDAQQCDATCYRQPNDRPRAKSRTRTCRRVPRWWRSGGRSIGIRDLNRDNNDRGQTVRSSTLDAGELRG